MYPFFLCTNNRLERKKNHDIKPIVSLGLCEARQDIRSVEKKERKKER